MNVYGRIGLIAMILGSTIYLREEVLSYLFVRFNGSHLGAIMFLTGATVFLVLGGGRVKPNA